MNKLKTTKQDSDSVTVSGIDKTFKNSLDSYQITRERIFMTPDKEAFKQSNFQGFSWVSSEILFSTLWGLNKNKWTGRVSILPEDGLKKNLFFLNGVFVFANSSSMSDSLGEVLYRNQLISLKQLTESATQVKKGLRFGEVLMNSKIMTYEQLWEALQKQCVHILDSIFILDKIYFELFEEERTHTELCVIQKTTDILIGSYSWSVAYKDFCLVLSEDEKVVIEDIFPVQEKYPPETFLGDLILMIRDSKLLSEIIAVSNLPQSYTIASLMQLIIDEALSLETFKLKQELSSQKISSHLLSKYHLYLATFNKVNQALSQFKKKIDLLAMCQIFIRHHSGNSLCLSLDESGSLTSWSYYFMSVQCKNHFKRKNDYIHSFELLTQFVLMLADQYLEPDVIKNIKSQ